MDSGINCSACSSHATMSCVGTCRTPALIAERIGQKAVTTLDPKTFSW